MGLQDGDEDIIEQMLKDTFLDLSFRDSDVATMEDLGSYFENSRAGSSPPPLYCSTKTDIEKYNQAIAYINQNKIPFIGGKYIPSLLCYRVGEGRSIVDIPNRWSLFARSERPSSNTPMWVKVSKDFDPDYWLEIMSTFKPNLKEILILMHEGTLHVIYSKFINNSEISVLIEILECNAIVEAA